MSISDQEPWCSDDEEKVEAFYRKVVGYTTGRGNFLSKTEWEDYGSGFASYYDSWFYRENDEHRIKDIDGEGYMGVWVLLSKFSPYYVMGEGSKNWHREGGGSYMPWHAGVDEFTCELTKDVSIELEALLSVFQLQRLSKEDLSEKLDPSVKVQTVLGDRSLRHFDALFYWED